MALGQAPATLDPRFAPDAAGDRIGGLIFNSLVRLGPDLNPVPDAAENWTVNGRTYHFVLRPDLRFHNGRPVTAEDVEFSFAQARAPSSPFASSLNLIENVAVSEKAGRITVDITVKNHSDRFLKADVKTVKLIPKREVLAAGQDFGRAPIGTGGYKFKRQGAGEIELESVGAVTKNLVFKIIRDDFTRYQKLMKGEVDIAQMEITPERVADFQKHPEKFQVFLYPGLSMTYVLVNFRDPWLATKPAREALSRSINREEIIRHKLHGFAREATSLLTPQNPYFAPEMKNPEFNLEVARRLAANPPAEIVLKTSNAPQAIDNGKVLAYQMSRTGVKVRLQSFEWGTFYNDVKRGNFQLATMKWVGVIDPDIYKLTMHSAEKPPGRNRGSYANAEMDRLLDLGSAEPDFNKRREIFMKIQRLALDDIVVIPLWYDQQVAIAKKNIRDYAPDQTGDYRSLLKAYKN